MKHKIYMNAQNHPILLKHGLRKLNIEIRLDDCCKNGHEDFAITGDYWSEWNKKHEADGGGCIHDTILAVRPDLKIFVDLHLCDRKGVPMHALANGMYFLFNEKKYDYVKEHFRISNAELEILKQLPDDDKEYFQYVIEKMQLPKRWQMIANQAIERFESLTGEKYVDRSTKDTFIPLSEEKKAEIRAKILAGHYKPEAIVQRKKEKKAAAKAKVIQDLKNEFAKKMANEKLELAITLWFVKRGYERFCNVIFYNHSNILAFNWKGKDYKHEKVWTKEEFDRVVKELEKYPPLRDRGVKFELK